MSSEQAAVYRQTTTQVQAIANAWYQSVNQTAFVPFSAIELRQRLVELTEKALDLLQADNFEVKEAQAMGAALVDLHLARAESIGKTVELLARELPAGLSPERQLALQPRLSALLGGITQGFFQQASKLILSEQESVRQANVATLKALYSERQQQQERLARLNQELQAYISERARVEEALRASEEQFRVLFEESPVALWAIDGSQLYPYLVHLKDSGIENFRVFFNENRSELLHCIKLLEPVDVNQQALNVAGLTSKEDLLAPPYEILNQDALAYLSEIIVGIANHETEGTGTATGLSPAGQNYSAIYRWSVPRGYEQSYSWLFLSFVDITAQKEVEIELQETAKRLETLHKIESGILQADSPEAIAEIALKYLESIVPCTASSVTVFQSAYTEAVLLAGHNMPLEPGQFWPTTPDLIAARMQNKPYLIHDATALSDNSIAVQTLLKIAGRSLLSVPIFVQSKLIGTINLIDTRPNAFSEEDVETVREVGDSVAIAIQSSQLLEQERRARREAETMREIVESINTSLKQEELLQIILAQLRHVLYYDSASILMFDNGSLVLAAQRGVSPQTEAFIRDLKTLPPNIVKLKREKRPSIIADVRKSPDWIFFPGAENIRCWLGVPLIMKEKLLGLLVMEYSQPNFYQDQDAAVALAFANHAAIAIENANLYSEVQRYAVGLEKQVRERTRELAALYKVTAMTSQYLDLQEILDHAMVVIRDAVDCDAVSIQLLDETGSMLYLAAHNNLAPSMLKALQKIPTGDYAMPELLEGGDTIVFTNPPLAPKLSNVHLPQPFSHGVATSILVKGQSLGVLSLSYHQEKQPVDEDVALINSIAEHLGVAIENTRLQEQSEQLAILDERERLARELHDSATQSLFSLTLFAAAAREYLSDREFEEVNSQLVELEKTAIRTHKEMRLLVYELRPKILEEGGLEEALRRRMQLVEFRSGMGGQITIDLDVRLPLNVEEVLFQVANEALNNALKHSMADLVIIDISKDNGRIIMSIMDNGQGFAEDDTAFNPGMGMENMFLRVEDLGGTLTFQSRPDQGTIILVQVPFDEKKELAD